MYRWARPDQSDLCEWCEKLTTKKLTKAQARAKEARYVGALWAMCCLLLLLSVAVLVVGFFLRGPLWVLQFGYLLLALAAITLLTMFARTLPRQSAYDWDADFRVLHPLLQWPLRVGTWLGGAVILIANIGMLFTGGAYTAVPGANARFAMSLLALIGAILTLLSWPAVPEAALYGLLIAWGLVVVGALLRGLYGFFADLFR